MARYVVIEIYPEELVDKASSEIIRKFNEILGIGSVRSSIAVVFRRGNRIVVRVPTRHLDHLRASVFLIRKIDGTDVLLITRRVSGTLRRSRAHCLSLRRLPI